MCLDYAKIAEIQRQTQLHHAPPVKNPLFKHNQNSWFHDEGSLATIGTKFKSRLGNVGSNSWHKCGKLPATDRVDSREISYALQVYSKFKL